LRPGAGGLTKKGSEEPAIKKIHPNCITFSDSGRMFVGDSVGTINVWDVALRQDHLRAENHFKIVHKELEGDEINNIEVHPEHQN
jgi:hypothetical protein